MEKYLQVMKMSALFAGIEEKEILAMLDCLSASRKKFIKNEFIFREGEQIGDTGLVLTGSVHVIKEDFWGNRMILTRIFPGQLFGETYACLRTEPLEVAVEAAEETEVLMVDCKKVLHMCNAACTFHSRLIQNLLWILAGKNLMLTRKMNHISRRTTREKLLSFLSEQARLQDATEFYIPFNRQQLADYLAVDRSAMSSELGRMKREGLLDFHKNHFILYQEKR